MSDESFLLGPDERPTWVEYPPSFHRLVAQGLTNLAPWHIMTTGHVSEKLHGLALRYPQRKLFPFAWRQDNDDVACWSEGSGEKVFVVHDFASPGWEDHGVFDSVWSWFRSVIDDMVDWE